MPKGADDRYKWVALSNTTLGSLLATIDSSIMLIALPDIFRGIRLDPLLPQNSFYFLWMILSYLVVTSVLVVSLGRLGDMYGRVRMYNLGFVIYTLFSLVLTITPFTGQVAALWLVVGRIFQGVGAAFLVANSSAILTDAFPENQRGMALGINNIAGISGSFIGLVLGGLLAPINWRLVFLVSVPVGLFGTVWAYLRLREVGSHQRRPMDWWGNLTFALGLVAVMIGITYGIQPYHHHTMGWTSPVVLSALGAGVVLLVAFALVETRVAFPMFRLALFRIRAFTAGTFASFLAAIGRGGLMFMLIIWLQGIWLPQHGYSFSQTPLWAGIYMLPLTFGFLLAGPISGILSDRYGARPFATGGMIAAAGSFFLLELLPVNFSYLLFAGLLLLNGLAMGAFASPNRAAVMNSLPARHRGVGSGMNSTFQNSATVLSIGVFFTLMIVGLAGTLPTSLTHGLAAYHVPADRIREIAHQPPVSVLFSAFLGFNPVEHLVGPHVIAQIAQVHPASAAALTGRSFFPQLISEPFRHGLSEALDFAVVACLVAAAASWLRGGRYVYVDEESPPVTVPSAPLQPSPDGYGPDRSDGYGPDQPDRDGRRARGRTRSRAAELDHVVRSSSRTPMKPRRW
ncbi:MAG: MFS transporter [Acidimicrobiales bacterium]|nr:MFS transporter [Acidimicrobiales bacterium]